MLIRQLLHEEKTLYQSVVTHPLQSWEWGEFKQNSGLKVIRMGQFDNQRLVSAWQLTTHHLPKIPIIKDKTILYCPRGPLPDAPMLESLTEVAKENRAVAVKLEPNIFSSINPDQPSTSAKDQIGSFLISQGCRPSSTILAPFTFHINLNKSEDELLAQMKEKTRYNVNLAQKKGVQIQEDNSDDAFNAYLELMAQTTSRQGFLAHDARYHTLMWQTLKPSGIAHLFTARYQNYILAAWILFKFKDHLYYPYGASSRAYKEVMANNLLMWEAIRWGKAQGCKVFDLWGTPGPNPSRTDPWFGFHQFKAGYGPQLIEYIGAYDLVVNKTFYPFITRANRLRRLFLKTKPLLSASTFN